MNQTDEVESSRWAAHAARFLALFCSFSLFAPTSGITDSEIFPVEELRRGLKGTVSTVITGLEQERLEIEILGVLDGGIGPGVPLILCRLSDERGEWVGVAAGMSGSPVTIDGRLLGALSYSIGSLSKEPVCGVTPIRTMLEMENYPEGVPGWHAASSQGLGPVPLNLVGSSALLQTHERFSDLWEQLDENGGLSAIRSQSTLVPAATSTIDSPMGPGDPVGALLVWGDLQLAATGTITWREGDDLLAFGHPFLGSGRSVFPMAPAEVIHTVPSLASSFKIAAVGEPVGRVTQDRLTAIRGRIGDIPSGMPLEVTINRDGRPEEKRQYFIARDPLFLPLLSDLVVRQSIVTALGSERLENLAMTATIHMKDGTRLDFSGVGAGGTQTFADRVIGAEVASRMIALIRPPMPLPDVDRVEVSVTNLEPAGAWSITRLMPDRLAARPGDTINVHVELEGPQGLHHTETIPVTVPMDARKGTVTLMVSSSREMERQFGSLNEARKRTARSAAEYMRAVEHGASDSTLEARLARAAEGMVSEGRAYPDLPMTAHRLMRSRPGTAQMYRSRCVSLASQTVALDRPIQRVVKTSIRVIPE